MRCAFFLWQDIHTTTSLQVFCHPVPHAVSAVVRREVLGRTKKWTNAPPTLESVEHEPDDSVDDHRWKVELR